MRRWECSHSSPSGPDLDLYLALEAAIHPSQIPVSIRRAANNERGAFLYPLFQMAYTVLVRRFR